MNYFSSKKYKGKQILDIENLEEKLFLVQFLKDI